MLFGAVGQGVQLVARLCMASVTCSLIEGSRFTEVLFSQLPGFVVKREEEARLLRIAVTQLHQARHRGWRIGLSANAKQLSAGQTQASVICALYVTFDTRPLKQLERHLRIGCDPEAVFIAVA